MAPSTPGRRRRALPALRSSYCGVLVGLPAALLFLSLAKSSGWVHLDLGPSTQGNSDGGGRAVGAARHQQQKQALLRLAGPGAEDAGAEEGAAEGGAGKCSIYVLDPAVEFGLEACNYSNPAVWPFDNEKPRFEATPSLKHWEHQYSTGHWVAEAIKGAGAAAPSLESAGLVYVNMHCYDTWWLGYWWEMVTKHTHNPRHPHTPAGEAWRAVRALPRYKRSRGRDFVTMQFYPVNFPNLREGALGCNGGFEPYPLVSERSMFCPGQHDAAERGRGLILPHPAIRDIDVAAEPPPLERRNVFLLFQAQCNAKAMNATEWAIGMRQRLEFIRQLERLNQSDIVTGCSHVMGGQGRVHTEMVQLLRHARFCPLLSGDTQSSKRQTEVILEGCIPVFVGPPFHTLPLAQDIDYAGMGLFLSVAQRPWVLDRPKDRQELADWAPDADIEPHVVRLDSLAGVYPYLKGLPPAVVAAKHAAVLRERLKMYYAVPPGRGTSVLGDLILAHLCRHAAARRQARRTEEAAGARAGPLSAGGVGEEGGDEDEGEGQRFDYEAADRRAAL